MRISALFCLNCLNCLNFLGWVGVIEKGAPRFSDGVCDKRLIREGLHPQLRLPRKGVGFDDGTCSTEPG
ncbi:MAG: hypothetical protein AVDCRST_MAG59-3773 [uncultured Thermomicrobiales bacterium]|uniref:Uncharacterized protein n=1 Tax=uncultured Thermomicrobiales bacterium TaxID=1645740 RepID=A0A6J4VDN2_9BACT|nr:MAG: hypothetical protein AVDCRST_MAG59-3773 [uncultured Thermomicrobiales bacterium]